MFQYQLTPDRALSSGNGRRCRNGGRAAAFESLNWLDQHPLAERHFPTEGGCFRKLNCLGLPKRLHEPLHQPSSALTEKLRALIGFDFANDFRIEPLAVQTSIDRSHPVATGALCDIQRFVCARVEAIHRAAGA